MSDLKTIEIKHLKGINYLVITKEKGDRFFYSNDTTITISVSSLATLLNFLVKSEFISHKVLEGILEEFYTSE